MKNFAIFYNNKELDRSTELHETISSLFYLISSESDNGLFFIQSEDSAESIEQSIIHQFEITLDEILYVMELGSNMSASGTSKTIRAIEDAL